MKISSIGFKSIRVALTMHGSSFNDIHLVAKKLLKLKHLINKAEHYFILFFVIKYF